MNGRLDLSQFVFCFIVLRTLLAMECMFPFCSHNPIWPLYDEIETIQVQKASFVNSWIQNRSWKTVTYMTPDREGGLVITPDSVIHIKIITYTIFISHHQTCSYCNFSVGQDAFFSHVVCCSLFTLKRLFLKQHWPLVFNSVTRKRGKSLILVLIHICFH